MKIVEESYDRIKFQVKIKNKYVTVATLQRWLIGWRRYELYFSYYGDEYNAGMYACSRFNGNVSFTVKQNPHETYYEMIGRVSNIVRKKLYQIANDVLNDIKVTDSEGSDKE